ncbi:hypothetical protein [Sphingobium sp. CAP-1]|uniref:hypothetical protein n=1 Tax=Sphingobium sp. CAP-1 TaxID=2676077 RepID=UPI0012BB3A17|nr:hypothetical protein [Sphingobium sp. CAP-1]QGP79984.1 hypothetical protein GL174_14080 [Sphingobium sp. CAP-1]
MKRVARSSPALIAKVKKKAVTLLYDRSGRPFSGKDRKNACCYLLENGSVTPTSPRS